MSNAGTPEGAVRFSYAELVLVNNALNEVLHGPDAIAAAEFQTRTGVCIEEAKALLARIGKALETMHAHRAGSVAQPSAAADGPASLRSAGRG